MNEVPKIRAALKRIRDPLIRERLLMIQAAYKQPLRDVAKTFCCTHGKIDYWKKRYERLGLRGLHTKPQSGRPPRLTDKQAAKIRRKVRKHNVKQGWTTKHVRSFIYKETGMMYSERQIMRITQSWGLSKIKPRKRYAYSRTDDREDFIKKQKISSKTTT